MGVAPEAPEAPAGLEAAELERRYQALRREYDARFRR
jgi:hypothetical protein